MPTKTPTGAGTPASAEVKRSPRERLLQAAHELFYAEGVQTVGIDRIIDRAGVAKASLYSTFGSKEELVHAYLDDRHVRMLARLHRHIDAAGDDPVERLLAVFDGQAEYFSRPEYNGCAFTRARAEAAADSRIAEAAASYRRDVRALLTELASAAGVPDAATLAQQLHMLYDGGAAQANQDDDLDIAGPQRAAAAVLVHAAISAG